MFTRSLTQVPMLSYMNPIHTLQPMHATWCAYHYPPSFDHPNNSWWRVQIMELLIMQFFPASCHFIPLRSKYSPKHLFSNTLNLCVCSFFNVRDQVSHPYKPTGKIIVLYILIFMLLDSRWEDSWMQFWFVNIPKYFNFTTFSKDLLATCMSWFCPVVWWMYSLENC
jgi:hypothetical protein